MHQSLLWRQWWMLHHIWTCSNISSFPCFSRTVTTHFLTGQYSTLSPGNDIISQWHISQVVQLKCTWYHLASLLTWHHAHWFPFMVRHQGLSVLCATAVIQDNVIAVYYDMPWWLWDESACSWPVSCDHRSLHLWPVTWPFVKIDIWIVLHCKVYCMHSY